MTLKEEVRALIEELPVRLAVAAGNPRVAADEQGV
jgi:hypothetical protein